MTVQSEGRLRATIAARRDTLAANAPHQQKRSPATAAARLAIFHETVVMQLVVGEWVAVAGEDMEAEPQADKSAINVAKSDTLHVTVWSPGEGVVVTAVDMDQAATGVVEDMADAPKILAIPVAVTGICRETALRDKSVTTVRQPSRLIGTSTDIL